MSWKWRNKQRLWRRFGGKLALEFKHAKIFVSLYFSMDCLLTVMTSVLTRIVELIGWVVLGFSVLLLFVAHHIDNYQSPEPTATASLQKK